MRALWAAGLLMRRLRAERGIVILIVVVVAATSIVFASAPRLFDRAAADGLRQAIQAAPPTLRHLSLTLTSEIRPDAGGGVSAVRELGDRLEDRFPPTLAGVLSDRTLIVTTVRLMVSDPPSYDTRIALRYQDGLTDTTRIVDGRWPVDRGSPLRVIFERGGPGDGGPSEPTVVEVALAKDAAADLGIRLGERLAVTLDGSDPLFGRFGPGMDLAPTVLEIVGLYEPIDRNAEAWAVDATLLQVVHGGTEEDPTGYATAYVPAESYPSLFVRPLPYRYEWRYGLDQAALDADQVAQLQVDLRAVGLTIGAVPVPDATVEIHTGLPGILERYAAERSTAEAILSIATIGPLGLAGGAFAMLALLLVRRRAAALALARGRGASGSLVLGTQLWEAIVLTGGAALAGLLIAVVLLPGQANPLSAALAVGVGGAAVLLLVGANWSIARRPPGQLERDDPPVLRVAPRRLVIELTIVAIAVVAALLLRQRGLTIGAAGGATAGATDGLARSDPLLASVPVLSGLAAGIIAARLYPLPIRALGWLAARRRDIVPVLGLRTIGRQPAAANVSVLVLMLAAAFGAFSSVVASSLERGQLVASYLTVGADYRVETATQGPLARSVDPAAIPGIEAVAPGIVDPAAAFSSGSTQASHIYVQTIDPVAYDAVTAGTPADPQWPDPFLAAPMGGDVGTADNPIPAILSFQLPGGSRDLVPGDTFRLTVDGKSMTFRLVQERSTFAGIVGRPTFAVVPFNWVEAAIGKPVSAYALWLRATGDVDDQLAASFAAARGSARIVSRFDAFAALHDPPLEAAIRAGFGLAVGIAAIYMALTIIGAMVLAAARHTRDLAFLRTLGVSAPQVLGLTIVEHAIPVLLALAPGVALGIGVAALCEPGLGLATLVGTPVVPLFVDWPGLALMIAALIGVVAAAVAAGTWLAGRAPLVDALRFESR